MSSFMSLEVEELERQILMEKHLISPEHTQNTNGKGVIISEHEDISIMVNEEDHLRIQVLFQGQLKRRGNWPIKLMT